MNNKIESFSNSKIKIGLGIKGFELENPCKFRNFNDLKIVGMNIQNGEISCMYGYVKSITLDRKTIYVQINRVTENGIFNTFHITLDPKKDPEHQEDHYEFCNCEQCKKFRYQMWNISLEDLQKYSMPLIDIGDAIK